MRYIKTIAVLIIFVATSEALACDDSGRIDFFDAKNGVIYKSYSGGDSNSAFLAGKNFRMAAEENKKEGGGNALYFWLNDALYQLHTIHRGLYSKSPKQLSDEQNLLAHFTYEYGYVKELSDKGVVKLGEVKNYGIVNFVDGDKQKRNFYIWSVIVGGGLQQYVSTSTSDGVQLLSVIVADGDFNKSKSTLDNYMYSYRILRGNECIR
jgi:hypothetical protein